MFLLAGQSAVRGVVSMSIDHVITILVLIVKPRAKSREVLRGKGESEEGSNVPKLIAAN